MEKEFYIKIDTPEDLLEVCMICENKNIRMTITMTTLLDKTHHMQINKYHREKQVRDYKFPFYVRIIDHIVESSYLLTIHKSDKVITIDEFRLLII